MAATKQQPCVGLDKVAQFARATWASLLLSDKVLPETPTRGWSVRYLAMPSYEHARLFEMLTWCAGTHGLLEVEFNPRRIATVDERLGTARTLGIRGAALELVTHPDTHEPSPDDMARTCADLVSRLLSVWRPASDQDALAAWKRYLARSSFTRDCELYVATDNFFVTKPFSEQVLEAYLSFLYDVHGGGGGVDARLGLVGSHMRMRFLASPGVLVKDMSLAIEPCAKQLLVQEAGFVFHDA